MRKAIVLALTGLALSLALAATVLAAQAPPSKKPAQDASAAQTNAKAAAAQVTPLNMNTGVWQTTIVAKYSGLPPQMASAVVPTTTFKHCLKPKALTSDAWAKEVVGLKCSSVTVLKSTATDTDIEGKSCNAGNGMMADGHGKYHLTDSEHLTGTMDVTFSGDMPFGGGGPVTMHADYTSKWLGATCPADLN